MSCWLVTKTHIDTLVAALIMTELLDTDPDTAGKWLIAKNVASVRTRYPAKRIPWMPGTKQYTYTQPPRISRTEDDLIRILKAVHCYQYQCDEAADFAETWAGLRMEELDAVILCCLPEPLQALVPHPWGTDRERHPAVFSTPAYEAAPWGIF